MFPRDGISARMILSASPFRYLICEFKRRNQTCWTQPLLDFSFSEWTCPQDSCNPMAPFPCRKAWLCCLGEMACRCQTIPVNKETSLLNSVIKADLKPHSPISFNSNKTVGLIPIGLSLLSWNWFWVQLGEMLFIGWPKHVTYVFHCKCSW